MGEPHDDGCFLGLSPPEAVEKLRELHGVPVAVARGFNFDEQTAQDVAQEALRLAILHIESFRGEEGQLEGWLRTITRRQCLDLCRKSKRREMNAQFERRSDMGEIPSRGANTPSRMAREDEERDQLVRLLSELVDGQREALFYRYFEGWSIAMIARQMEISEDAVKGLLKRGLVALRTMSTTSDWSQLL